MIGPSHEQIESFDLTLEEAEAFLLAGGTFNLWDWMAFPQEWRAIMVAANDRVQTIWEAKSFAAQTEEGIGEMLAPVDGGVAKASFAVTKMSGRW